MADENVLEKLEAFAQEDNFPSGDYFLAWARDVETQLWLCNPSFAKAFNDQISIVQYDNAHKDERKNAIKRMHAIVGEAIVYLRKKMQISKNSPHTKTSSSLSKNKALIPPEKVTLVWLVQHVSVPQWFGAAVFLAAVFGLGITFGRSQLYDSLTKQTVPIATQAQTEITKNK